MKLKLLKAEIEKAINNLMPYFKVSCDELKRFRKPTIRRFLKPDEYPDHSRNVPAYSSIDNFIYFPLKEPKFIKGVFSKAVIYHESGHFIHNFVNPGMIEGVNIYLKTGKLPEGYDKLTELVAEYGNFILNLRTDEDKKYSDGEREKIYDKYGPEFLPYLARISLEEAIEEKIIKI
ncbi:MAG: hypothetical protein WC413_01415 [Candidatus Nanoarchaeia archaeon]